MPPAFATAAEERAHRKERLAGVLRLLGRLGYEDGVGGHVTVRDPEFDDCYWVNPFGRPGGPPPPPQTQQGRRGRRGRPPGRRAPPPAPPPPPPPPPP
ncbi:class II aldolase/adducin family protein, partial [Streptomyces sp. NPDC059431]|uniref:class II aldolase/adducin family protein n=1 Tax=Streptomyces sp. NPDC059431 TaxID=3346828 RepID=UPI003698B1BC